MPKFTKTLLPENTRAVRHWFPQAKHEVQYISKLRCPFIKTKSQQNKTKTKKSQKLAFDLLYLYVF